MGINFTDLQIQFDMIYSYLKTTTEPFDFVEWDGKILDIWFNDIKYESYTYSDLKQFIKDL